MPDDFFTTHDLCWLSDHEIVLQDKLQKNFVILCNAQTIPDQTVLQQCSTIKEQLASTTSCEKKGKHAPVQWIADVRFKNQIIVSSNGGGQQYG